MHDPDTMRERTALDPRSRGSGSFTALTPPVADEQPTRVQTDPATPAPAISFPTVPGYELLDVLGRGGMGIVYKARQLGLNRLVAVKVLPPHGQLTGEEWSRFVTEAELLARCAHPNIVQVHNFGAHEGVPFLTLEYVEGGSLAGRLKGTPQAPLDAAALIETAARAVSHAHEQGIIHRDLKPANVLLTTKSDDPTAPFRCTVKIADFGLARSVESESALTRTGAVMGTPSYMAPEQAFGQGDKIGPPVDIHALGAILYEMLTGRPPFKGATPSQTLEQVRSQDAVEPRLIVPTIPLDLQTICLKCLEKEPGSRYSSALALAEDLRRFRQGEPIVARPALLIEKGLRWIRRRPTVAALYLVSFAALVSLILLGMVFVWHLATSRHELELAHAETERQEAETHRQKWEAEQAELRAATHAHYRGLNTVRDRRLQGLTNWREANLRQIDELARRMPPDASRAELRTEAVAALATLDIGAPQEVTPGITSAAVAYSPDGRLLALAQHKAQAWTFCCVYLLDPHTGRTLKQVVFFPDLRWQAARDVQDGSRSVAFSPDGRWLVVGTRSGNLHRWDLQEEKPRPITWKGHEGEVRRVAFLGESLYSCSDDRTVKRWEADHKWKEQATFTGPGPHGYVDLEVSPHGWIAVTGNGHLTLLDDKKLTVRPKPLAVHCDRLAVGPIGRTLFLSENGAPMLVDAETLHVLHRPAPAEDDSPTARVSDIKLSPDGRLLAIASDEMQYVDLWDIAANQKLTRLYVGSGWARVAFRPDSSQLTVVVDKKAILYPIEGRDVQHTAAFHPRRLYDLDWGAHGLFVYAGRAEGGSELTYWPESVNGLSLKPLQRWPLATFGDCVKPLTVNRDDGKVVVRVDNQRVECRQLDTTREIALPWKQVHALQFAPDGRLWTSVEWEVQVRAQPQDKPLGTWSNVVLGKLSGLGEIWCLAVGSSCVLAGGRDGMLRRFNAQVRPEATWSLGSTSLTSVSLNPDQSLAAVGTLRGELIVLNPADGTIGTRAVIHRDSIESMVWLSALQLLTSSRDGTIILWDLVRSGAGLKLSESFTYKCGGPVRRLSLSPDGHVLAVCVHGERAARLWHLDRLEQQLRRMNLDTGALAHTPTR